MIGGFKEMNSRSAVCVMKCVRSFFGLRPKAWYVFGLMLAFTCPSFSDGSAGVLRVGSERDAPTRGSGIACYYGAKYHGKPTASGEIFDMDQLTAAHPRLAFGTRVKVTHLENHRSVIVRINDRGPFIRGRVIDLSLAAAEELQMVKSGLAGVKLEIVE